MNGVYFFIAGLMVNLVVLFFTSGTGNFFCRSFYDLCIHFINFMIFLPRSTKKEDNSE